MRVQVTPLEDRPMSSPAPSRSAPEDSPSAATTSFWDKIAEGYAKKPVANPEAYERKLVHTRARLDPDDVLLDIGCGTGSLVLELAPLVRHAHGLDISGEMVRIARGKASAGSFDNVTFHHTQIEAESAFAPESFDVVTAYNLLHLVDDLDDTLTHIFRLLKPGGTFVSSTSCLRESWVPYKLVIPIMRLLGKAPHVLHLQVQEILDAMARVGFVEIKREIVTDDRHNLFALARKPY